MAYVVAGMYGEVRELGAGVAILIVLQVCSSAGRKYRSFMPSDRFPVLGLIPGWTRPRWAKTRTGS